MPPGSAATLRRLGRRAILCLLLGAILQYLVAVAFSVIEPNHQERVPGSWVLLAHDEQISVRVEVIMSESPGRDTLAAEFWYLAPTRLKLADVPFPNLSRGEWERVFEMGSPAPELGDRSGANGIPLWSRLSDTHKNSIFDQGHGPRLWFKCVEVATGWPLRSASFFFGDETGSALSGTPAVVTDGVTISSISPASRNLPRVIPLKIYRPGAIINTLVYAAALLVPFTLIPWTRHRLRRRAGRCPNCNYDLRATTTGTCPECGAQV